MRGWPAADRQARLSPKGFDGGNSLRTLLRAPMLTLLPEALPDALSSHGPRVPSAREADAFGAEFCPRAPGHPVVRDLHSLLCQAPAAHVPLEERLTWVEALVRWLRAPPAAPSAPG